MTKRAPSHARSVHRYRDRILDSKRHDPYESAGKHVEGTQCEGCGVVFHHGRWQWGEAPSGSRPGVCPACRRIRDSVPAGEVLVDGDFVQAHAAELVNTIRNVADHERLEHPLHRIMRLDQGADRISASTTDIHLPQRIGEALERAYDGRLEIAYGHDDYSVRVHWSR